MSQKSRSVKFRVVSACREIKYIRSRKVLGLAFRRSLLTFGTKNFSREVDEEARLQVMKMRKLTTFRALFRLMKRKGEGELGN